MRMIDAEEAKRVAREYVANPYEVISACAVIDNTPTVDAVQVVRCKDCRYSQIDDLGVLHCHKHHIHTKPDDFCSYGERKEPENDQQN